MLFAFLPLIAKFFTSAAFAWGVFGAGLLYGLLNKPKQQVGDKLDDYNIMAADYGGAIPIIYGTSRVNCQYIWYDFRPELGYPYEYQQRSALGGNVLEYHYTINFAVAITTPPGTQVTSINKIWLNSKVFYDPFNDDAVIRNRSNELTRVKTLPSEDSEHQDETLKCQLVFYYGNQTEPDPYIEEIQGSLTPATEVPAFEEVAYVVFKWLQITTDYGNSPPTVSMEVTTSVGGTVIISTELSTSTPTVIPIEYPQLVISDNLVSCLNTKEDTKSLCSDRKTWHSWDMGSGAVWTGDSHMMFGGTIFGSYFSRKNNIYFSMMNPVNSYMNPIVFYSGNNRVKFPVDGLTVFDGASYILHSGYVYRIGGDAKCYRWLYPILPAEVPSTLYSSDTKIGVRKRPALISLGGSLYCLGGRVDTGGNDNAVFKWNATNKEFDIICADLFSANTSLGGTLILDCILYGTKMLLLYKKTDGKCYLASSTDGETWALETTFTEPLQGLDGSIYGLISSVMYLPSMVYINGYLYIAGGNPFKLITTKLTHSGAEYPVLSIVQDIADRVGYDSGSFTLINHTVFNHDTIYGYTLTSNTDGKSALASVQRACAFDIIFHSAQMHLVSRGVNTAIPITDDIGWVDGSNFIKSGLKYNRKDAMSLPNKVIVTFPDQNREYNSNTQSYERVDVASRMVTEVSVAISMTETKARKIAEILLLDAYNEATTVSFTLPATYSYLVPTDVLSFTVDGVDYVVRLKQTTIENGLLNCEACLEDLTLYSITPAPTIAYPPANHDTFSYAKSVLYLDIPRVVPLGEQDGNDGYGFYIVACPFTSDAVSWEPLEVLRYEDDFTWKKLADISKPSVMGYSDTALGTCSTVALLDKHNTVDVTVLFGTLSTVTAVENTSINTIVLGDEIIQFKTATLLSAGKYRLSNLYRGLYGTEWAIGTHTAQDRFALLDNTTYIPVDPTKIGATQYYRTGTSRNGDYAQVSFASNGLSKKPFAPCHLHVTAQDNDIWKIEWMGRVRGASTYFQSGIVNIGENREEYEIEFYDDSGVKQVQYTVIIADKALTGNQTPYLYLYPEDRALTDVDILYGQRSIQDPLQSALKFKIYQIGSIGRGYPLSYNI